MATIDSLDIQISAQANSANKAIGALSQNLSTLSRNLGRLNGNSLTNFSSAMKTLSDGMKNFNGINAKDFTPIADGIKKFSDVDTGKISSISGSLKTLADGLNTISGTTFNAESLNGISSALSRLGSIKGTAGADNLLKIENSLSQFVAGMNRIGSVTFDTANLSNLINSISRMGSVRASDATKNLPTISAQLQNFVHQLNKIGSLTFDSTNLSNLITSISKLGNKSAAVAATNLPILTKELESLMKTLSKAPKVSDNVIDMTNALASLARTGASSGRAANSLSRSLDAYSLSASRAGLSTKSFRVSLTGLVAKISSIVLALGGLKKAIDISSDLTEVQNVVDVTFGDMKQKVEDLASVSIQDFGMSELTAKQIASRFQAMGVAMGFSQTKMSDMSIELTKLAADMASFYNVAQEDVARSLQSIFTGESEPLRRYGWDLTQATLQEWALNNGINANIQAMSQAEKTMLRYQYVMANSAAISGDFARTSDSWSNTIRTLKQNFEALGAVIGGTLINAFKPFVSALNSVMQSVISFAKTVANALGAIFGWTIEINPGGIASDFEAAGAGAAEMEKGTGGAAKNLKGMSKYIAAWQEVNSLTSSDASGGGDGGAGGGDAGTGAADAAEANLVKVETIFDKYKSEIDNLYDLGKYIGDTLSRAMESINWDSVYEKARNFGTGLAEFLNGLISPRLFGNVGKTIAGALNTALNFLDSFGQEFDWKNFGLSIAAGINNFFATFDFGLLANTIDTWVQGLWTTIKTALFGDENGEGGIDWGLISDGIKDFFSEIDIETIAIVVGAITFKNITKQMVATGLLKSLGGTLSIPNLKLLLTGYTIGFVGGPALDVIGNEIITYVDEFIRNNFGDSALNAMGEGLLIAITTGIGSLAGPIGSGIGFAIGVALDTFVIKGEWITGFWNKIGELFFNFDLANSLLDKAKNFFEDAFSSNNFFEFGANIIAGVAAGFTSAIAFLLEPIGDLFDFVVEHICDLFGINSPAEEMKPLGKNILLGIAEGFSDSIGEWIDRLFQWKEDTISVFADIKNSIVQKWNEVQKNTDETWSNIKQNLSEKWENIKLGTGETWENLKETVSTKWEEITQDTSEKWENVKSTLASVWEELKSNASEKFAGIESEAARAWSNIKESASNMWNSLPQIVDGVVNKIINSVQKMVSGITDAIDTLLGRAEKTKDINYAAPTKSLAGIRSTSFKNYSLESNSTRLDAFQASLNGTPELAKGGVLKKGQWGFLEGDGAEAVVPLERNTEWINNVAKEISDRIQLYQPADLFINPVDVNYHTTPYQPADLSADIQEQIDVQMATYMFEVRRQNELLEEQNALLERIYDKTGITEGEIFNATRKGVKSFQNRTKKNPWPVLA